MAQDCGLTVPLVVKEGPSSVAALHHIPSCRIVSIEHPCIIKNLDRGLKSLGGEPQMKHVLEHKIGETKSSKNLSVAREPVVGVSLRPNDPFAKRIPSVGVETRNVLVKVTLPRRTGRKRKRGSDDSFEQCSQSHSINSAVTAPQLLRRLQDCENTYSIATVGMLRETHRFRALPDFQLRNADLPLMRELRDNAIAPDYERLKQFQMDLSPGAGDVLSFPGPPNFTHIDLPFKYEYQQAPGVVVVADADGNATSKNIHRRARRVCSDLPPDIEEVPQRPPPELRHTHPDGLLLPIVVKELEKLLAKRPLASRRVMMAAMPAANETIFKEATQFVGYSFIAGPFRDLLIKYGVDPRKDPKYRVYQTMMFQMDKFVAAEANFKDHQEPPLAEPRSQEPSYTFDGKSFALDGKTWQICDLTDPVLQKIFQTEDVRAECDVHQFGWYHNGTIAKGRVIMKDKMKRLCSGQLPNDEDYTLITALPECLHQGNIHTTFLSKETYGDSIWRMATDMRALSKPHMMAARSHETNTQLKDSRDKQTTEGSAAANAQSAEDAVNEDVSDPDDAGSQGDFHDMNEVHDSDGDDFHGSRRQRGR